MARERKTYAKSSSGDSFSDRARLREMPARNRDNCVVLYSYSGSGTNVECRLELTGPHAREFIEKSMSLVGSFQNGTSQKNIDITKGRSKWISAAYDWMVHLGPGLDFVNAVLSLFSI